jgi:hypothetical protein
MASRRPSPKSKEMSPAGFPIVAAYLKLKISVLVLEFLRAQKFSRSGSCFLCKAPGQIPPSGKDVELPTS